MTAPTIAERLKYAELQMAAEAFLKSSQTGEEFYSGKNLEKALVRGNDHNSKFTQTQAEAFADKDTGWTVLDQIKNTPTGFSGTLFKSNKTGEIVISLRSTEFVDDAARDNQATNVLEIKDTGFAWGQIRDMEAWVSRMKTTYASDFAAIGNQYSVTGYSLGGHLATVYNMLHPGEAERVVTFNGAGVGGVDPHSDLAFLVGYFKGLTSGPAGTNFQLEDANVAAIYARTAEAVKNGEAISMADNLALRDIVASPTASLQAQQEAQLVLDGWNRVNDIRKEVDRLAQLKSGLVDQDGNPINPPAKVSYQEIGQIDLDYQMAVVKVSKFTDATSLLAGVARTFFGKPDTTVFTNQYDLQGYTSPSAVSNSQWHFGTDMPIFIENQPLYRGGVVSSALLASLKAFGAKLLVDGYATKDFGDTHSLVLMMDSLVVQNVLTQMLPPAERAAAGAVWQDGNGLYGTIHSIMERASNRRAVNGDMLIGDGQGKAAGDALENVVNALADLALGPGNFKRLLGSPEGNTWADLKGSNGYTGRNDFYEVLQQIQKSDLFKKVANGDITLELVTPSSNLAADARTDFGAYAALYSLSPFAFKFANSAAEEAVKSAWGPIYDKWATTPGHASEVSNEWLTNRNAMLERVNYFNAGKASYNSSEPGAYGYQGYDGAPINTQYNGEDIVWVDRASGNVIQRGGVTANTRYMVFGEDGDFIQLRANGFNVWKKGPGSI